MTNNLPAVASQGAAVVLAPGIDPFLAAGEDMGASSGALYVKFDGNTGRYSVGKDEEELEKGSRHALAPTEFKNGWICWKNGAVMEEIMVRIESGLKPPPLGALPDYGPYEDEKDGWREQSSIQFRDIETGAEFLYKTSSRGGRIALGNLSRDYGKTRALHEDELPIIEIGNTSFEAKDAKGKKLGKKYAPVFKIVGWQSEADLIAKFEAAAAASEDAAEEEDVPLNKAPARPRRNF